MKCSSFWVASLGFAAFSAFAQVEVIDRPVSSSFAEDGVSASDYEESDRSASSPAQASASNPAEMFYQFQVMQQELLELRGLVEQQSHEIKKLKQQRLDDYVDLDRRISSLSNNPSASAPSTASTPLRPAAGADNAISAAANSTTSTISPSPASEIAHYKSATKLVLMDRNYDAGIARLEEHLALYPNGRYTGNAQYWLGEVYLAKGDLPKAKQWFETLLADSPLHAKVSDAKYKLGTTYHQLGDDDKALSLLKEVAASSGSAASLADKYLSANF